MGDSEIRPDFLHVDANGIVVRIQTSVYGEQSISFAAHKFTDRCFVHLERSGADTILCRVVPKAPGDDARALAGDLANEILDQMLRARLQAETEGIRRLLLAQAFSRTNILHPELDAADPGVEEHPVGKPEPRLGPA